MTFSFNLFTVDTCPSGTTASSPVLTYQLASTPTILVSGNSLTVKPASKLDFNLYTATDSLVGTYSVTVTGAMGTGESDSVSFTVVVAPQ